MAVGWMKPVFRYGCAVYAAILGGRLLYALLWDSFQSGRYFTVLPMILCMIAGGAVGYYAASMLLAKTPRVFKTTWKGMLAVALGCAALCGAMVCGLADYLWNYPRVMCIFWFVFALTIAGIKVCRRETEAA